VHGTEESSSDAIRMVGLCRHGPSETPQSGQRTNSPTLCDLRMGVPLLAISWRGESSTIVSVRARTPRVVSARIARRAAHWTRRVRSASCARVGGVPCRAEPTFRWARSAHASTPHRARGGVVRGV